MNKIDIAHPEVVRKMRKVSRGIIIFPVVMVVLAVLIQLYNNEMIKRQAMSRAYMVKEEEKKEVPQQKEASAKISINLTGPYICQHNTPTASLSAYIKDRQVNAMVQEATQSSHVVIAGDCLYRWKSPANTGDKMCGIEDYLNTFDTLASFGMLNASTMLKVLPEKPAISTDSAAVDAFINSCTKKEIPNDNIFAVPGNVQFKEVSPEQLQLR